MPGTFSLAVTLPRIRSHTVNPYCLANSFQRPEGCVLILQMCNVFCLQKQPEKGSSAEANSLLQGSEAFPLPFLQFSLPASTFLHTPTQFFSVYPILPRSEGVLYSTITNTL